jgi:hypothetical protein
MTGYDIIIFALLIYFGMFLSALAWMGLVTQAPIVHRCPFTFQRPTIYLLLLALIFLDSIIIYLGEIPALIIFIILVLDTLYETIRPFISHSVMIECATQENIRIDLLDAFNKLGLRYEGKYPKFKLPDEAATLKVKYWPRLSRGNLTIYPKSKMDLLLKIAEVVEKDFSQGKFKADIRGYVANIFVAFAVFIFAVKSF